jgi:hypothetical protein
MVYRGGSIGGHFKKPMTELSAAMIGFLHLYVKARLLAVRGLSTVRAAIRSWSRR